MYRLLLGSVKLGTLKDISLTLPYMYNLYNFYNSYTNSYDTSSWWFFMYKESRSILNILISGWSLHDDHLLRARPSESSGRQGRRCLQKKNIAKVVCYDLGLCVILNPLRRPVARPAVVKPMPARLNTLKAFSKSIRHHPIVMDKARIVRWLYWLKDTVARDGSQDQSPKRMLHAFAAYCIRSKRNQREISVGDITVIYWGRKVCESLAVLSWPATEWTPEHETPSSVLTLLIWPFMTCTVRVTKTSWEDCTMGTRCYQKEKQCYYRLIEYTIMNT